MDFNAEIAEILKFWKLGIGHYLGFGAWNFGILVYCQYTQKRPKISPIYLIFNILY